MLTMLSTLIIPTILSAVPALAAALPVPVTPSVIQPDDTPKRSLTSRYYTTSRPGSSGQSHTHVAVAVGIPISLLLALLLIYLFWYWMSRRKRQTSTKNTRNVSSTPVELNVQYSQNPIAAPAAAQPPYAGQQTNYQ